MWKLVKSKQLKSTGERQSRTPEAKHWPFYPGHGLHLSISFDFDGELPISHLLKRI